MKLKFLIATLAFVTSVLSCWAQAPNTPQGQKEVRVGQDVCIVNPEDCKPSPVRARAPLRRQAIKPKEPSVAQAPQPPPPVQPNFTIQDAIELFKAARDERPITVNVNQGAAAIPSTNVNPQPFVFDYDRITRPIVGAVDTVTEAQKKTNAQLSVAIVKLGKIEGYAHTNATLAKWQTGIQSGILAAGIFGDVKLGSINQNVKDLKNEVQTGNQQAASFYGQANTIFTTGFSNIAGAITGIKPPIVNVSQGNIQTGASATSSPTTTVTANPTSTSSPITTVTASPTSTSSPTVNNTNAGNGGSGGQGGGGGSGGGGGVGGGSTGGNATVTGSGNGAGGTVSNSGNGQGGNATGGTATGGTGNGGTGTGGSSTGGTVTGSGNSNSNSQGGTGTGGSSNSNSNSSSSSSSSSSASSGSTSTSSPSQ